MKYTVDIVDLSADRSDTGTYDAADQWDAMNQAVHAVYGKRAHFIVNNELAELGHYGQIFKRLRGSTYQETALTNRVRIDIEETA